MLAKDIYSIPNGTFITLVIGYGKVSTRGCQEYDNERERLYEELDNKKIFHSYAGSHFSVDRFTINVELNDTTRELLNNSPLKFTKYRDQFTKEHCIKFSS